MNLDNLYAFIPEDPSPGRPKAAGSLDRGMGGFLLLLSLLLVPAVIAGPPPTDWRWLLPSEVVAFNPFSPEEFDVAHGNGIFVGVGGYGAVATSPDGLAWTVNLPGTFDYFASVAFGGATFVAGGGGVISTSADGVHWEHHSQTGIGDYVELRRIRYLGGQFVAIGWEYLIDGYIGGVLYTSTNGQKWTERLRLLPPGGHDVYLAGIAYGNGRFVGVGGNFDGTARLLISGGLQRLRPLLELRGDAVHLTLRIRGTTGEIWHLQQSVDILDWQTVRAITLESESQEIEVTPLDGGVGFWRLSAP